MATVLIIDDNISLCEALSKMLVAQGHQAIHRQNLSAGQEAALTAQPDVIFLDVGLPDGSGLDMINILSQGHFAPEIIIITGQAEVSGARQAIESGAWDYVEKGASLEEMILPLNRALQYRAERRSVPKPVSLKREGIIGESPAISDCLDVVAQAAVSDLPVLLNGETGTGKELFSWAIHENSQRADHRFVVVDCAALPESLVESLLFGYEPGAFTGASRQTDGLIKEAHGGTLFLDEVGEMPLNIQKAFLRVLQEQSFRRIGGLRELQSDFRVIAATNRDLDALVREGTFRQDLMYRLANLKITLPPLRERGKDIELLTVTHLNKAATRKNLERKGFTQQFVDCLYAYDWPGNVRELFNVLDQALIAAGDAHTLYHTDLPPKIRFNATVDGLSERAKNRSVDNEPPKKDLGAYKDDREIALSKFEKEYLSRLMDISHGQIQTACDLADLSRPRLYELLRKHGITKGKK